MISRVTMIILISSMTLSNAWSQELVPEWLLEPVSGDNALYGIGISDLNGTVDERKQQSLKRAVVNLALLHDCDIKSMNKSFIEDNQETSEIVAELTSKSIPEIDQVQISRRWREKDGHVYTEVKIVQPDYPDNSNQSVIKYYSVLKNVEGKQVDKSLSLQLYTKWDQIRLWESVTKNFSETYQYEHIYVEYAPEFKQWFGEAREPEWFETLPLEEHHLNAVGSGEHPNLHVAMTLAYISAIRNLSMRLEEKKSAMTALYGNDDNADNQADVLSTISRNNLKNIIVEKNVIGISQSRDFFVYTWLSMTIN